MIKTFLGQFLGKDIFIEHDDATPSKVYQDRFSEWLQEEREKTKIEILEFIKEMVEKQSLQSYSSREVEIGFEFCKKAIKSLLDEEINKVKEL